jgi:hypothetical protein
MSSPVSWLPCYLVEWYGPQFSDDRLDRVAASLDASAASMCAEGSPVQLVMTLAVPADEVLFGVFAAGSAHVVTQACQRAGMPAARLTAAVEIPHLTAPA